MLRWHFMYIHLGGIVMTEKFASFSGDYLAALEECRRKRDLRIINDFFLEQSK